ncbi:hypothetical protein [Pelagibacterium luteolum]|uniref:Uncharacterized protein n=1 Tax=Pelagibacterium luteolum TaxID=440168 RepID=A0A1G7WT86_9HYPH|nr:hypothetical protein [Pelagibacterium luteolum]SDG75114.1 hypothetical protein SAMN04487974_107102 [Pelagibacterium luteolum]
MSDKPSAPTKLIVVIAFEDDGEGGMRPAFDPREFQSEDRAKREAGSLANHYPAVIAWSREAKPDIGEYGEPEVLFSSGPVPTMD